MKVLTLLVLGMWLAGFASAAATVAYNDPTGTGNQTYTGSLGMDFNVISPILITALGAYDSDQNGFNGTITTDIYDRTTSLLVAGLTVSQVGTVGTLIAGDRFITLGSPIALAAGFQGRVVAYGYGANADKNGNDGLPGFSGNTTNTGGGLISFVGTGTFGPAGVYPTNPDGGPANRYAAGDFQFQAPVVTPVPEPTTLLAVGSALVGLGLMRRRKKNV
jgi:hypothetical protein